MPLFEGAKPIANSRSHSRLSVSQVFSPAERWIHDPILPQLFEYSYGGPGHVVLTKGTIVAFGDTPVADYETGKTTFPVTYANGANKPIGVLPYNVYQKVDDRLLGNQPSILTHEYIELPLIVGINNVYDLTGLAGLEELLLKDTPTKMKMKWGCFYTDKAANIKPGDLVKPDRFGKFIKWNENKSITQPVADFTTGAAEVTYVVATDEPILGTSFKVYGIEGAAEEEAELTAAKTGPYEITITTLAETAYTGVRVEYASVYSDPASQIIGQVLAIETDMPPLGWLQWVTPVVETGERAIDDNKLGAPDANKGYQADPNYRFPLDLSGSYTSPGPWKDYQGIPGLTDGAVSKLGPGILPGWDFAGSVGAIRIALRY